MKITGIAQESIAVSDGFVAYITGTPRGWRPAQHQRIVLFDAATAEALERAAQELAELNIPLIKERARADYVRKLEDALTWARKPGHAVALLFFAMSPVNERWRITQDIDGGPSVDGPELLPTALALGEKVKPKPRSGEP